MKLLKWGSTQFPLTVARGMRRGAVIMERGLRENLSGGILQRRTSTLVRTVGTKESDGGLEQRIGATTFYLATHEGQVRSSLIEGEFVVIKPVRAQRLTFELHVGNELKRTKGGEVKAGKRITQWVSCKQARIPIRRPVGITYRDYRDPAFIEAWKTLEAVLDGDGE